MGIGRPRYVALVSSKPNSPFETPGTNNFTSCLREEKGGGGGGGRQSGEDPYTTNTLNFKL